MIYRGLSELGSGDVVARPVYAPDGRVLLKPGTVLTERYVEMLERRGIGGLHVTSAVSGGTLVPCALSEKVRSEGNRTIGALQVATGDLVARLGKREAPALLAWLASAPGQAGIAAVLPRAELGALANALVDDVLAAAADSVLRVEKNLGEYGFAHSVDVATVAVAIARELGFGRTEMVELARGALVHDLGMATIDRGIREKAGPLTEAERAQVQLHPRLGFELLRALQPEEVLPNHIALQHHERLDGSGYPQGLFGGPRVGRSAFDPARSEIVGLAEICAVADVYDALSSPRPYRPALPHDQVRATLRAMADTKLSGEAVGALLRKIPLYPLGGKVVMLCRQFPRHRATVVRRNAAHPDRPVVRLYGDGDGAAVEPIEIDLSVERGILIRPAV